MTSIVTWNVNSIKARLPIVLEWLREKSPDIVLLQELKCVEEQFPHMEIEELGYNIAVSGQKTYNGVAILSKYPIEDVSTHLPLLNEGDEEDPQARYIEAVVASGDEVYRVVSVYVPNGQAIDSDKYRYKMQFFDRLYKHVTQLLSFEEKLVIGGDYNVAPETIDVFDPKSLEGTICFHPDERAKFRALLYLGLTDGFRACNKEQHFSWWDYRGGGWQHNKGLRIDTLLLSPQAADTLADSHIESELRGKEKASDHAPVWIKLAA